jgi:hypothetical protein
MRQKQIELPEEVIATGRAVQTNCERVRLNPRDEACQRITKLIEKDL